LDSLLSAIGRPYTGYYRSIVHKAAALLQSIATNHAFYDGNKRTSVILLHLLLDRSGYSLEPSDAIEDLEQAIEDFVVDCVVTEKWAVDAIGEWLSRRIRKADQ
jgi:death-on-curing protein